MGGTLSKNRHKHGESVLFHPTEQSQREAMAAWHREGVAVTEVYDIIEIIGHGHMGEVCAVARKKRTRGSHINKTDSNVSNHSSNSSRGGKSPFSKIRKSAHMGTHGKSPSRKHPNKERKNTTDLDSSSSQSSTTDDEEGGMVSSSHHERGTKKVVNFQTDPPKNHSHAAVSTPATSTATAATMTTANGSVRRLYACKTVSTARVKSGQLEELLNEISIMRALNHPYILQLFEVYQVKRKLWLITELCTGGDLTSRTLDEPEVAVVLEQILSAVAYMHRRGVCHRDIKLENIMYEHPGSDAGIKLIDFGLSQQFTRGTKMRRACGTAYTISPELVGNKGGYSEKTDIWGVGVVAFVLLSGDFPFLKDEEELKDEQKLERLLHARYLFTHSWNERGISKAGKEFVHGCLRKHPGVRWTASEALNFVQNTWIPALEESNRDTSSLDTSSIHESSHHEAKAEEATDGMVLSPSSRVLKRSMSCKRRKKCESADTLSTEDFQRFCSYGLMKKTILMTMAYTMDKSSLGKLKELFLSFDTENTGTISLLELEDGLRQINAEIDDDTVAKIFEGIDQDHSGQIHYAEFLAAVAESQGLITMERLAEAFDRIDTEGKGYISKDNIRMLLGNDYNEEIVNRMIDEADFKNNGQVDYEEFLRLMFEDPATGVDAVGFQNDSELAGLTDSLRGVKIQ